MSPEAIAAAAAVTTVMVTMLGGMGALIYKAGQHAHRLATAEQDISDLQEGAHETGRLDTALQVLNGSVTSMGARVDEISHDVKNLLTGKITPARHGGSGQR